MTCADDDLQASPAYIDALCNDWVAWARTRRYFGPPPLAAGVLGKLTKKGGPRRPGGPDARCSAEMSAFNAAIAAQPHDIERTVFLLHYVYAVDSIKAAAPAIGISRATWYRHLNEFTQRVYAAHLRILADNIAARDALPHYADSTSP